MRSKQFEHLIDYAQRHTDDVVCVDRDGSRESTFGDWLVLSRKVAAYLKANLKEINPEGEYLLLECPNGLEFEAAELGAWMVGCAIVPLGSGFPEQRRQFIKSHCNSRFTFTPEVFDDIYRCEPIEECIIPDDHQPALLLYTSGSTGTPKGVMHRIASLATIYINSNYDSLLRDMSSMLVGYPSYVIMGATVFLGTSIRGLVNHFIDAHRIADPQYISAYIQKHNIDCAGLILPVIPYLSTQGSSLQTIITGGAQINHLDPDAAYTIYLLYGATELCAHNFMQKIDRQFDRLPIGVIDNQMQYQITDDDGHAVQDGLQGELWLKTKLDVCYYKDPVATASLLEGGWLHTGDMVVREADGQLYFVGRKDSMIKINGSRVEPAEVERALSRVEGITMSAVRGFRHDDADKNYLCAYYTTDMGIEADYVRCRLTQSLPSYMVPQYIIRCDTMPLTGNGKVDVQKLPLPDTRHAATGDDLLGIVRKVMGRTDVGIDDNLIGSGLTSIMVLELCSEIEKRLSKSLSPSDILLNPTVSGLLSLLENAPTTPSRDKAPDLYPITSEQKEMLEDSLYHPDSTVWLLPMALKMKEGTDRHRLISALRKIADIHLVLKARIVRTDQRLLMKKCPDEQITIHEIETDKTPDKDFFQQLVRPFDLLNERLISFCLVRHHNDLWLLTTVHNGLIDGTSIPSLIRDLGKAYHGEEIQDEVHSHFDYVLSEQKNCRQKKESDQWFSELLKDKQTIDLPYSAITAVNTHEHDTGVISAELTINEDVAEICKRACVTESTYFVYRMLAAMQSMQNIDNGILWVNSNRRVAANLGNAVGMFLKLIPVVMPHGYKQMTLEETLNQLQTQMLTSMSHESLYFKGLNFIYQGDMYLRIMNECSRLADDVIRLESEPSMDPLVIEFVKEPDGTYSCNIIYDRALYNDSAIDALLQTATRCFRPK